MLVQPSPYIDKNGGWGLVGVADAPDNKKEVVFADTTNGYMAKPLGVLNAEGFINVNPQIFKANNTHSVSYTDPYHAPLTRHEGLYLNTDLVFPAP
jgi:hypothetical protein